MADRIAEPASSNPMTADWQTLLNKLTVTTGSFYLMDFSPYDGTNSPKVKMGSRFEINASFFFVATDEEITGFAAIPNNSTAYVYAIPNQPNPGEASTCTFEYNTTAPIFNIALGGMFNGVNRCIGWIEKLSGIEYRIWGVDTIHAQNVAITGIWHCPTPPLPP